MFFANFFELPSVRSIEFSIDLISGVAPISKALQRKGALELKELKSQLEELEIKGFIRLSTSLWGLSVFLIGKKDGGKRLHIKYR